MARELKFRAWHNKAEKMLNTERAREIFFWQDEGQDITIMQYTGLKDKNGKEIYEGDIVVPVTMGLDEPIEQPYVIKWREDVYAIIGDSGGEWLTMEEFEGGEVIGNIWEQPELVPTPK